MIRNAPKKVFIISVRKECVMYEILLKAIRMSFVFPGLRVVLGAEG